MVKCPTGYCPLCKAKITFYSEYLEEIFIEEQNDEFAYWFACLVTHYRHEHINYYDRTWQYSGYKSKNPEARDLSHDEFKIKVNNRAKRQLIRAIVKDKSLSARQKKLFLLASRKLQYNDEKTSELIKKQLKKFQKYVVVYQGVKI